MLVLRYYKAIKQQLQYSLLDNNQYLDYELHKHSILDVMLKYPCLLGMQDVQEGHDANHVRSHLQQSLPL